MSSRLVAAVIALAAFPQTAGAQAEPALRAREQRLAAMHAVALAAAERAESLLDAKMEIVREGILTLRVRPAEVPLAREAGRRALVRILHAYGDAAALASDTLLRLESFGRFGQLIRERRRESRKEWRGPQLLRLGGPKPDVAGAENEILANVEQVVGQHRSHAYEIWNRQVTIAPFTEADAAGDLASAYVDLVTVPSPAAGSCFAGDLRQCHVALALTAVEDPATQWFTASERLRLVPLLGGLTLPKESVQACVASRDDGTCFRRLRKETIGACIERRDDATCIQLLRSVDPARLANPLATTTRRSLLRYALETGGRGAYLRFVNGGGTIAETLSRSANISLDSLVSGWHAAVIAAKPRTVTTTASMGWVALAWCVVFSLLTLRSSRWNRV